MKAGSSVASPGCRRLRSRDDTSAIVTLRVALNDQLGAPIRSVQHLDVIHCGVDKQLYKRCYIGAVNAPSSKPRTLGTALRHLLELLDGDVAAVYKEEGLNYRPRFTPIVRALASSNSMAIRDLAAAARISHSAASQTVARMKNAGLVEQVGATDARERAIRLTRRGKALLPKLEVRWRATNAAAEELEHELSERLTRSVEDAIAALEARSFKQRIRANEQRLLRKASK